MGAAGINDEIGFPALLGIGHLAGEQLVELLGRHAGPLQNARALRVGRSAADDDDVDAGLDRKSVV
jgi:hypothetical protein